MKDHPPALHHRAGFAFQVDQRRVGRPVVFLAGHGRVRQRRVAVRALDVAQAAVGLAGRAPLRLKTPVVAGSTDAVVLGCIDQLAEPYAVDGRLEPYRRRAVLAQLICRLLYLSSAESTGATGLRPRVRQRALAFIHDHLAQRFTIADLAEHVGLNPAYFALQFRRAMGLTAQAYIKRARANRAAQLLADSNLTLKQIAGQLGYCDAFFLSKQFKDVFGQSPRAWRLRHG